MPTKQHLIEALEANAQELLAEQRRNRQAAAVLDHAGRVIRDRDEAIAKQGDMIEALSESLDQRSASYRELRETLAQLEAQKAQLQSNLDTFRDRFIAHQVEMKMEARFWGLDIVEIVAA